MMELITEHYELTSSAGLKTKNGKGFTLVYVDPKQSTDNTYDNKELMKKYGMEYFPYNRYIKYIKGVPHAWGWVVWDGQEKEKYPLIKKFAEEIGDLETPIEGKDKRTLDEVLSSIESIKDIIMSVPSSEPIDGKRIIADAEELKKKLINGIGSKETMDALAELVRFRMEMKRHRGPSLSMLNTIMVWLQKKDATDVRSKGEWEDMGYSIKEGATPIYLSRPAVFRNLYGSKYDEAVRRFLKDEGVELISDLTPSQKRRLDRVTKYPDMNSGFAPYLAYDISDVVAGENAEQFPEDTFKWFDKESKETKKTRAIIDACVKFANSIGIKDVSFQSVDKLGGARGYATSDGKVVLADDKRNRGLAATAIHEIAHQLMHFEIVHTENPRLKNFYMGGSAVRGKQIVEQEADLCSWLVLTGFGYKGMQEHFNYLANWGMNIHNCNNVFDSVMKVANYIYDGLCNFLEQ